AERSATPGRVSVCVSIPHVILLCARCARLWDAAWRCSLDRARTRSKKGSSYPTCELVAVPDTEIAGTHACRSRGCAHECRSHRRAEPLVPTDPARECRCLGSLIGRAVR